MTAAELRQDLCARNLTFAQIRGLNHVSSYGQAPVVVYAPEADGSRHGNFLDSSYRAILKHPQWARRIDKVHTQSGHALPRAERRWRELDSCTSSDALLMNIFCCPRLCRRRGLTSMLGTEPANIPEFGYKARVPLLGNKVDRTEIDMKLGGLLVEAKLTESDFQTCSRSAVESYRDLKKVFEISQLPRVGNQYVSYQLIRNVLAAHATGLSFCVMVDARRQDLIEAWYRVMRCVRDAELRTRCKVLTWQELSGALPRSFAAVSRVEVWNFQLNDLRLLTFGVSRRCLLRFQMSIEEFHCSLFEVAERPTSQRMRLAGIAYERNLFP